MPAVVTVQVAAGMDRTLMASSGVIITLIIGVMNERLLNESTCVRKNVFKDAECYNMVIYTVRYRSICVHMNTLYGI